MTSVMQKTAYHFDQGPVVMYAVDAQNAVQTHPDEWSWEPWSRADADKARAARDERRKVDLDAHKRAVEEAKAAGLPLPLPLPPLPAPPPEPTDAEKAAIEADTKARAEAAERVRVATEEAAEQKKIDEQLAADKALLATPPPVPDPTIRRPFGRKGEMTDAERKAADKRATRAAEKDGLATQPEPDPDPPQPQPQPQPRNRIR